MAKDKTSELGRETGGPRTRYGYKRPDMRVGVRGPDIQKSPY